ncbi:hypothetical protein FGU71_08000 [Erythrobacter insulae]|uniref:CBM-cenC domain-containing protein n=1 Tax=Erythrobacter insulae TaxID=2584124 RepID=A0A547PCD9_9SPHN|nr:hypothetical protein [Erythrobacter insulae]TRD11803.1 hypothetical protein FGU71_08000 [Erythrobacter insulae]
MGTNKAIASHRKKPAHLKIVGAALCLAAAGLIAAPAAAQDSPELKALDAQLPGDLVNNPSRIDWQSYGADLEASAIVDDSIPGGGAARRFEIKRASEFIYTAGTNVPLTEQVKRGKTITVGFYARTVEADTPDGLGIVRVRFQQNAEPFPGFGEETLSIGKEWAWYEVTAEAEQTLRSSDGIVSIQFGRTRQIIEIGQAIVVSGASKIAEEGPVTVAAARSETPELEMPDGLADLGSLINNPGQARWKFGGSAGTYANRDEPEIWMMKATRFEVAQPGTNLTDLYATIPIEQAIAKGDKLTIAIAAKTIGTAAEDGKAVVASRIQGTAPPFDSFASNRFKIGTAWQLIKIETQAPRDFTPGGSELQVYFGGTEQQVDLGPVYVFKTD